MAHAPDPARNAGRRLADLRAKAAAAGLPVEEYARRRAAKLASKAAARAAKAAAAVRKPAPIGSTRMATAATADAPQASPERPWLIDGILRRGDLVAMDGDAGAALTLALDLGIHLAAGVGAWGGRAIQTSRTKTLFVDMNYTQDIGRRIRTCEIMRQIEVGDRLRVGRGTFIVGSKINRAAFISGVKEAGAPAVIIINNSYTMLSASQIKPDDAEAMGMACDTLREIQARLGHPAIVVLGGADSLLASAADRILHVQREGENVTMTATGMAPMKFKLVMTRGVTLPVAVDTVSTSSKKES